MSGLNVKAWLGLVFLAVVVGVLLFAVAGTARYWQGWVFLAVFFAASLLITLYLMKYDSALLHRRLAGGPTAEKGRTQRVVMLFASIGFVGILVVPALGYRLGWSQAPLAAVVAGNVLIAVGFYIVFLAFRENSFASARIEIAGDQRVISTGPYALIRHPQYAGAFIYLLGMPLALGSYWGLLVLVPMMAAIIFRLFDEEKLLASQLPGYAEYRRKVPSRLIPAIF
jgi:protein-S-isoprenylcysteine O-methyltransferase Ste14